MISVIPLTAAVCVSVLFLKQSCNVCETFLKVSKIQGAQRHLDMCRNHTVAKNQFSAAGDQTMQEKVSDNDCTSVTGR